MSVLTPVESQSTLVFPERLPRPDSVGNSYSSKSVREVEDRGSVGVDVLPRLNLQLRLPFLPEVRSVTVS